MERETVTIGIGAYDTSPRQLVAMGELARKAGLTGAFIPRMPFYHRPYPSSIQLVRELKAFVRGILLANKETEVCLFGLSMGGQIAIRVQQELINTGTVPRFAWTIATDPPHSGHNIVGWQGVASRGMSRVPGGRFFGRAAAQGVAIDRMMHGIPSYEDQGHTYIVSIKDGKTIINSNDSLADIRSDLRGLLEENIWRIDGDHRYLSPDISAAEKPEEEPLRRMTQANHLRAITEIVARHRSRQRAF